MFKSFIERSIFGVCTFFGDYLGIAKGKIRLYFIYLSFFTLGSSFLLYFFIAFWLNVAKYIRRNNHVFMGE
jgi:phage shock protein PspC (stress-responsive transcriptional regulator)